MKQILIRFEEINAINEDDATNQVWHVLRTNPEFEGLPFDDIFIESWEVQNGWTQNYSADVVKYI